ncbi:MAG: histidinol-phosphatase, partial [Armatimonadetes bacterium]|nr:histidinol-phosphatase [Armatimonadota bacterium]
IEVFNAKSIFKIFNWKASRFAKQYGKTGAAGSDAHHLEAIGLCLNEMEDFSSPTEFLRNLRNARLIKHF